MHLCKGGLSGHETILTGESFLLARIGEYLADWVRKAIARAQPIDLPSLVQAAVQLRFAIDWGSGEYSDIGLCEHYQDRSLPIRRGEGEGPNTHHGPRRRTSIQLQEQRINGCQTSASSILLATADR